MNKLIFFISVLFILNCRIDSKLNEKDPSSVTNLLANVLLFQSASDISFAPQSGTITSDLSKITLLLKYEVSDLLKEDLILYNNEIRIDYNLVKVSNKSYEIVFRGEEGKIALDLSSLKSKYNLTPPSGEVFWVLDQYAPSVKAETKLQNVHAIDLSEGNVILSYSEAVVGAAELSNYDFVFSDPTDIQVLKILKTDEKNYRMFFQSYANKPMIIKIVPRNVRDYAGNLVANEESLVNVYGFRNVGSMWERRCDFSAVAIDEENILLSGGINSGVISNTLEIFNVKSETFRMVSNAMNKPLFYHKSFKLKNGKILLVGGYENSYFPSAVGKFGVVSINAYLYDPVSDSVAIGPSLNVPRTNFGSVQLSDGSVVIIGGMTVVSNITADIRISNIIEILAPESSSFSTATFTLPTTLHSHSALSSSDGKILVFGGLIDRLDATAAYNFSLLRLDLNTQSVVALKTLQNNYIESFGAVSGENFVLGSGLRSLNVQIFNKEKSTISTVGGLEKSLGQTVFSSDSRYHSLLSGISGNSSSSPLEKIVHFSQDYKSFKQGIQIPEPKFCNATVSLGNKHYIFGGATNFSGYIKIAGGLNLSNPSSNSVWVYETK